MQANLWSKFYENHGGYTVHQIYIHIYYPKYFTLNFGIKFRECYPYSEDLNGLGIGFIFEIPFFHFGLHCTIPYPKKYRYKEKSSAVIAEYDSDLKATIVEGVDK